MKKKVKAIVWRKSVYDSEFRCNYCKCKVADDNGVPLETTLTDKKNKILVCPDCRNIVGSIRKMKIDRKDYKDAISGIWGEVEHD